MEAKMSKKTVVLAVALSCVLAGYVQADKAQLQEKLSRNIQIQLKDVTITEALKQIGLKAGAGIVLSDAAEWKLPQGKATRLSVTLDGPVAESLTEMLNAFFMRYAVGDKEITVYPRPELGHILGRPTTRQLELLKKIYCQKFDFSGLISTTLVIQIVKETLGDVSFVPYDIPRRIERVLSYTRDDVSVSPTFANLLEQILKKGQCWYLSGMEFPNQVPQIRVVSNEEFTEAKLGQIVDIAFHNGTLETMLKRLASWAGMDLYVLPNHPSWGYSSWPELEVDSWIEMENVKLRQAIVNIARSVGGSVEIDIGDNQIIVVGPKCRAKPKTPGTTSPVGSQPKRASINTGESYVGKISIPMEGGKYYIEFMLRESDLSEQLKKLREETIKEILGTFPKTQQSPGVNDTK